MADINDTRVKTVKYELHVSDLCPRATCLIKRLLRIIAFRVEGKRTFDVVRFCYGEEDGADAK